LDDRDEAVGITHVAAEDGVVHGLFDSTLEEDREKILYRRSKDGGRSFGASTRLDVVNEDGAPGNGQSSESDLAVEDSLVHVVWEDDPLRKNGDPDPCCTEGHPDQNPSDENRDDVFYTRSTDGGSSFEVARNLTDEASNEIHHRDPDVAAAGDVVAVVYEGGDVVDDSGNPRFDPDEDAPLLLETRQDEVFLRASVNGGKDFGPEVDLSRKAGGFQDEPSVDATGHSIHVVFRTRSERTDEDGGPEPLDDAHIRYTRSDDRGASFTRPVTLPGRFAQDAVVAAEGKTVHVVACTVSDDLLDPVELVYHRSLDNGRSFGRPAVLARHQDCGKPAVDVEGDRLHIAYSAEGAGLDEDVHYLRSDNGGDDFEPIRNLSANPLSSANPSVTVDPEQDGGVYVAWTDDSFFFLTQHEGESLPLEEGGSRRFADEDVIQYRGGAYRMILDGSDIGLRDFRIDALAMLSATEFVLSFTDGGRLPGVGRIDDSDLVLFTAKRLGESTAGTFSLYLDGSDIGLRPTDEDIDAVDVVAAEDGRVDLYLSTSGGFSAGGLAGGEEDVFVCRGAVTGPDTDCDGLERGLDGSAAGLGDAGVDAFSYDGAGPGRDGEKFFSYYSTDRPFSTPTARGGPADGIGCAHPEADPAATDPLADCATTAIPLVKSFDGRVNGLSQDITALEFNFVS
jgi:hypothetical protein